MFKLQPGTMYCVLEQDTLLSQCLSTQVYKWIPANLKLGADCPSNVGQLCRRQRRDEGADFPFRHSLKVIAIDDAIPGHAVSL